MSDSVVAILKSSVVATAIGFGLLLLLSLVLLLEQGVDSAERVWHWPWPVLAWIVSCMICVRHGE